MQQKWHTAQSYKLATRDGRPELAAQADAIGKAIGAKQPVPGMWPQHVWAAASAQLDTKPPAPYEKCWNCGNTNPQPPAYPIGYCKTACMQHAARGPRTDRKTPQ